MSENSGSQQTITEQTTDGQAAIPHIAILGAGSMGGAVLAGLRAPEVRVSGPIAVTTNSAKSAEKFAGASDVVVYAKESDADANRKAVRDARIVILAVKPWAVHDLLSEIAGDLMPGAVVASACAGITTTSMDAVLPDGVATARSMPNTPANIGRGVTGVAGGATASEEDIDLVRRVFETVGEVLVTTEDRINAVGAMAGSGPAYVFYFAEQFIAATERLGFSAEEAQLLVQSTISGAAELMMQGNETPAELRQNVTSPQGTTEQSVSVLQRADWGSLFDDVLEANMRRARQLAGEEDE